MIRKASDSSQKDSAYAAKAPMPGAARVIPSLALSRVVPRVSNRMAKPRKTQCIRAYRVPSVRRRVTYSVHRRQHGLHMVFLVLEEMIRALDFRMGDGDAALFLQLAHQRAGILRRRDAISCAVDDKTRSRAGRKEAEIIKIGGRRDRHEPCDIGGGASEVASRSTRRS